MSRMCRSCCGSLPFLGSDGSTTNRNDDEESEATWDEDANADEGAIEQQDNDYQPHSETQVLVLAKKWIQHVNQRAAKVWTRDQVIDMLQSIARSINFTDDPILGDLQSSASCVIWHGDVSQQQNLPVLVVVKPGQEVASSTYVSRILVFLFADDESLKILKQLGNGTFSMNCGNSKCVRLSHLVGYTSTWATKYQKEKNKKNQNITNNANKQK